MEWINIEWLDDKSIKPGWYAVLICFDSAEGAFPHGAYWDGLNWSMRCVSAYMEPAQDNEQLAYDLAYENDPEF